MSSPPTSLPPEALPPEVIKVSAAHSVTGEVRSAFCWSSDPDELDRVTNELVFGDKEPDPNEAAEAAPEAAEAAPPIPPPPPLSEAAVLSICAKHSLPAAYAATTSAAASNLLVFLPGAGESSPDNHFLSLGRKFELPQTDALALLGAEVLPFELGRAWFREMDYGTGEQLPWGHEAKASSFKKAAEGLCSLLEDLSAVLPLENVFLFGFSGGAALAMEVARRTPLLGGAVCVGGGVVEEGVESAGEGRSPVLMITGDRDPVFPKAAAEKSRRLYGEGKMTCVEVKGKGHAMINSERETRAVFEWISEKLARSMPTLAKMAGVKA
ncbi:hypothetical protein TeGR_g2745 [Tetraparma gracilis]|uniref:Phospholipase/carboxylesterase/thioesterase domain-containing protein n=1 Tax=Tetraparma gracilis TaxID=2962635 RepID=A0ABQ6MCX0_9STRA|nr:hypothetical protein TeGR_g2745 [Tetraparma gracilis]